MKLTTRTSLTRLGVPLVTAGAAAMMLLGGGAASAAAAAVHPLSAVGSNGDVKMTISGGPSSWNVSAGPKSNGNIFIGHIQIIGPNGFSFNGPDSSDPKVSNVIGHGAGKVCAIGWQKTGQGTYINVGEPCETVS
jgi:hypothetical protein